MNTNEQPTPETKDAFAKLYARYAIHPATIDLQDAEKIASKLERERDEARERIVFSCKDWADDDRRVKAIALKQGIDVDTDAAKDGYFRTVIDVAEAMSAQLEAMREAIKEAKSTLGILEAVRKNEQNAKPNAGIAMELSLISDTLAILQSFIKP